MSQFGEEFREIGHCGGKFIVTAKTIEDGRRTFQIGIRHSNPTPAAWFGVHCLPQGIPVGTMSFGGIQRNSQEPERAHYYPVLIASDSLGLFGHQCPNCKGYWRSKSAPSSWPPTCPYCGCRAELYHFLTEGQLKFAETCCDLIGTALASDQDGESIIDLDEIADAVSKGRERPKFYYVEQAQQNRYTCQNCGDMNDILGRYGYCSCCGAHNGLQELNKDIQRIQDQIQSGHEYENCTRNAVAAFDSYSRQIAKQLANRVPMTPARKRELESKLFHNRKSLSIFETAFDIDIFENIKEDDINFASKMFCRRHIYEHNGGEVDERYIRESGDTSVKIKQVIRESSASATRITELILKMGNNLHEGFHSIFPPEKAPTEYHSKRIMRPKN